jgi:hypothetical protein
MSVDPELDTPFCAVLTSTQANLVALGLIKVSRQYAERALEGELQGMDDDEIEALRDASTEARELLKWMMAARRGDL